MLKNYWFYYYPNIILINQHKKEFDFIGLDYFRYLTLKCSVYSAQKTRVPAFIFELVICGVGFEFCTHGKR